MRTPRFIALLATLVFMAAAGLVWQHRSTAALHEELSLQRGRLAEAQRTKDRHAELLARQVALAEVARRREEREAWVALAAEIKTLRDRTETKKTAAETRSTPATSRTLKDAPLRAAEWRDAGWETPAAAFETALWAAAGGDVEKLAAGLELDEDTSVAAAAVFGRLPPALRREVGTPEQLVALLTARDVPLGSAWILGQFDEGVGATKVMAQLADADGNKRELMFSLHTQEGRWRLVVPPQVMEKYTTFLQGKPAEPAR